MLLSKQDVIQALTHRLLDSSTQMRALACAILTNITSEVGPDDMQAEVGVRNWGGVLASSRRL